MTRPIRRVTTYTVRGWDGDDKADGPVIDKHYRDVSEAIPAVLEMPLVSVNMDADTTCCPTGTRFRSR